MNVALIRGTGIYPVSKHHNNAKNMFKVQYNNTGVTFSVVFFVKSGSFTCLFQRVYLMILNLFLP